MINLKDMIAHTSKYLDRIMVEIEPSDLIQICERAIAAEELAEARRRGAQVVVDEFAATCKEVIQLKEKLAQVKNTETVQLSAGKPTSEECPVWDLSQSAWEGIQQAAKESKWIPPEYYANDWHSDVQKFLREGIEAFNPQPKLTVWYGPMPESNGKTNWTALLHRADSKGFDVFTDGITIARSEYPERVLYEADFVRWIIGELPAQPDILAYDADKHSGYVEPIPAVPDEPTERQVYQWFQESTINHHIEEDGRHIAKRAMFVAKKAWNFALTQAKPQRITEQDAREIIIEFYEWNLPRNDSGLLDDWIKGSGSLLLAKLNEHREPKLSTHNLNHLELITAKNYSFMNCALCSHSVNVAVLVRSTNCSVHICESCAQAVNGEFK